MQSNAKESNVPLPNRDQLIARRKALQGSKNSAPAPVVEPTVVPPPVGRVRPLSKRSDTAAASPVQGKKLKRRPVEADEDAPDSPVQGEVISGKKSKGTDFKGLAKRSAATSTALALPMAMPDLTRQVEAGVDTVMPRLKISQAMSKVARDGTVHQGNFYSSPSNKNLGKTVYFVPVDMRKSRSYFVQGQGVSCRSFDLYNGEGDPGIACEGTAEEINDPMVRKNERGCPLRLWGNELPKEDQDDDSEGANTPPPCGINFNYPGLILQDPNDPDSKVMRAMLTFRSAGSKVAKMINTIVTEGDYRWHEVILELTITEQSARKGSFYNCTVEHFGDLQPGKVLTRATKMAEQINLGVIRATAEAATTDDEPD